MARLWDESVGCAVFDQPGTFYNGPFGRLDDGGLRQGGYQLEYMCLNICVFRLPALAFGLSARRITPASLTDKCA